MAFIKFKHEEEKNILELLLIIKTVYYIVITIKSDIHAITQYNMKYNIKALR